MPTYQSFRRQGPVERRPVTDPFLSSFLLTYWAPRITRRLRIIEVSVPNPAWQRRVSALPHFGGPMSAPFPPDRPSRFHAASEITLRPVDWL